MANNNTPAFDGLMAEIDKLGSHVTNFYIVEDWNTEHGVVPDKEFSIIAMMKDIANRAYHAGKHDAKLELEVG